MHTSIYTYFHTSSIILHHTDCIYTLRGTRSRRISWYTGPPHHTNELLRYEIHLSNYFLHAVDEVTCRWVQMPSSTTKKKKKEIYRSTGPGPNKFLGPLTPPNGPSQPPFTKTHVLKPKTWVESTTAAFSTTFSPVVFDEKALNIWTKKVKKYSKIF